MNTTNTTSCAHTPGPWQIDDNFTIRASGDTVAPVVAEVWCGDDDDGHVEANARLIAAAPELLAALTDAAQTARNYYAMFHDETWKARLAKWDAAIAKAEGR